MGSTDYIHQVVKIQVPLDTNEEVPMALIYNRDRSLNFQHPASDFGDLFINGKVKGYFKASFIRGQLSIHEEIATQEW